MGRNKGSKNVKNALAEKVKQIEEELEINIDTLIEAENKSEEKLPDKNIKSEEVKPDTQPTVEIVKPKTRFDDIRYILLAKDIHRLYAYNDDYESFEIKFRWFMIKSNLYVELLTRYWIDRFLHEYPYLSTPIVKQMLINENLL
jgi:hypothetical protein